MIVGHNELGVLKFIDGTTLAIDGLLHLGDQNGSTVVLVWHPSSARATDS